MLQRAVEQAEGALDAIARVVSPTGNVVELGPDWPTRLNAAKMLVSLVGAAPSKSASATAAVQTVIHLDVPEWAQQAAIAQERGRVIDMSPQPRSSEAPGWTPGGVGDE